MVRNLPDPAVAAFEGSLEPEAFFVGPPQEEAIARLEWLVEHHQRLGLVVAGEGCGKSHLAAMAVRRLGGLTAETVLLSLRGLAEGDFLPMLLDRLPLDPLSAAEPIRPWQKLEDRLRENTLMERPTVVILDDLDRAAADAIAGVERLVSSAEPRFSLVTVIGTLRPDGGRPLPPGLVATAGVRIDLPAWSEADTAAFLHWALERAGADPGRFSAAASATLQRLSGGVPRLVCQLAHLAVVATVGDDLATVEPVTVERAWRQLLPASARERPASPSATSQDPLIVEEHSPPVNPRVRAVRRLFG
jgi:general secretion pathway protein A